VRARRNGRLTAAKGHCGAATAIILPLDMTNHLALVRNERRHEYRRRLIAIEKSWRDAQVAILFGQASRKAAFATNDSGRYWRLSGTRQSGSFGRRYARSLLGQLAPASFPFAILSLATPVAARGPARGSGDPALAGEPRTSVPAPAPSKRGPERWTARCGRRRASDAGWWRCGALRSRVRGGPG